MVINFTRYVLIQAAANNYLVLDYDDNHHLIKMEWWRICPHNQ